MRAWNDVNPKVGAAFLTALVGWAVARFGLGAHDETVLLALIPVLAGYLWPEQDAASLENPGGLDESAERDG